MEKQHTPGPWYTRPHSTDTQGLVYSENTGENIAVTYDVKNAHLVAAAPELLDALKMVAEVGNPTRRGFDNFSNFKDAAALASLVIDLIQKVEG